MSPLSARAQEPDRSKEDSGGDGSSSGFVVCPLHRHDASDLPEGQVGGAEIAEGNDVEGARVRTIGNVHPARLEPAPRIVREYSLDGVQSVDGGGGALCLAPDDAAAGNTNPACPLPVSYTHLTLPTKA